MKTARRRRALRGSGVALGIVFFASLASAHTGNDSPVTLKSWSWEPEVVMSLAVTAWLYVRGLRRLRAATESPHKLRHELLCFAGGWVLLAVALVSPLHPWGRELFSAHMTQHELLMVGAAPLLVLGRPGLIFLWAFPKSGARELMLWNEALGLRWLSDHLTRPVAAWIVHLLALWVWHVPGLFQSTLDSELAHALQHLSFLGTAILFWYAVFYGPQRRVGYGVAVLSLFATVLQTGALGALITFAPHVWYPRYAATAPNWGLTPLVDQQLGGLIMWVPAGLVYVIAALALFARWLEESGTMASRPGKSATAATH
jgi:putative membrane protein